MKFIALYGMPKEAMAEMMKTMTPEAQKKSMEEWTAWGKAHPEIVDLGSPVGKNMRVTKDGASMMSNEIGGYSFIEAESQEAAAAVFKDSPHFMMPGVYVEIMPLMQM